jgi:MazG family protein
MDDTSPPRPLPPICPDGPPARDHGAAARPRDRLPLGHRTGFRHHRPLHDRGGLRGRRRHRAGGLGRVEGRVGRSAPATVYHTQMAEEAGHFTFDDVVTAIADKMVARHPHVFGDESRDKSAEQQTATGKRSRPPNARPRHGAACWTDVALALPALMRAEKLQKRAARVGFDWPEIDRSSTRSPRRRGNWPRPRGSATQDEIEDEMGDLLFVMANLARHLKVDPEVALRRANSKFTRRFALSRRSSPARANAPKTATWPRWTRSGTRPSARGSDRQATRHLSEASPRLRAVACYPCK